MYRVRRKCFSTLNPFDLKKWQSIIKDNSLNYYNNIKQAKRENKYYIYTLPTKEISGNQNLSLEKINMIMISDLLSKYYKLRGKTVINPIGYI